MIEIARVPAFQDNYIWLAHDAISGETIVVDPGEGEGVLAESARRGWHITQIWNTHWHADHTGGNAAIKAATGCTITGPAAEAGKIPTLDVRLREGDIAHIGAFAAHVMEIPAHTAGHIAFYLPEPRIVFVGDTLFAMGCGRLFEGTAAQMWTNMQRLGALPPETQIYCGHEYTQSNGRYARFVEPDNEAIASRMRDVDVARARGEATLPTTIALELATNPFMRAGTADELARRRAEKDGFQG